MNIKESKEGVNERVWREEREWGDDEIISSKKKKKKKEKGPNTHLTQKFLKGSQTHQEIFSINSCQ